MIPRTWENSERLDQEIGLKGDNDPIDVLELGNKPISISSIINTEVESGEVVEVRVLGALCLIDQGELDWKLLTLNSLQSKEQGVLS